MNIRYGCSNMDKKKEATVENSIVGSLYDLYYLPNIIRLINQKGRNEQGMWHA